MTDNPKVLGRYQIVAEISRGMMGVVYRAVDPVLGRTVALKTVNVRLVPTDGDGESFETRFLAEARAAGLLSHPAIVTVHDVGRDPETGALYIALEHLEGRTLADVVARDGPLPWRTALAITGRIAGGLDHAHQRGIVHRDVKPANIMILSGGEAKLMDFGIAKIDAADLTAPGDFLGTPSYMSPEQAMGAPLDGRSDIFSLGTVSYFMLTGRRPFDASTVPGVMARIVNDPPDPMDVAGLPPDVEWVVARCLARAPAGRYARALHLEEDAEDLLAGKSPRHRDDRSPGHARAASASGVGDLVTSSIGGLGRRSMLAIALGLVVVAATAVTVRRPSTAAVPVPAASPAARPPSPSPAPARLAVEIRHPFRVATVRVWVDDDLRVEERVPGRVTRDLVAVKVRRATFHAAIAVEPGERVVRVQVDDGDGFRASRRLRGTFAPAETRRLEAAVGGVIRKELDVAWGK